MTERPCERAGCSKFAPLATAPVTAALVLAEFDPRAGLRFPRILMDDYSGATRILMTLCDVPAYIASAGDVGRSAHGCSGQGAEADSGSEKSLGECHCILLGLLSWRPNAYFVCRFLKKCWAIYCR